MALKCNWKKNR